MVSGFADEVPVSSVQQVVMVDGDHVAMLVDDGPCAAPASELNKVCKRPAEPFVGPFDEADCLDDTAGDEYALKDDMQQERVSIMADVADSYEDGTLITMDRVSVVCGGQTEEAECCAVKELSSTQEQVLDHIG